MNRPPSKIKYEASHPVIAFRVSQELFDRIQDAKLLSNASYARLIEIGAGLQQAAHDEGFRQGFGEAKNRYCVAYLCAECGQPIEIQSGEEKKFCEKLMTRAGWRHNNCQDILKGR